MEEKIVYFEEPGRENTEETLRLAAERAGLRGIRTIVLASEKGVTARLAAAVFAGTGVKLVVVPHHYADVRIMPTSGRKAWSVAVPALLRSA